jgi:hypothetical protein
MMSSEVRLDIVIADKDWDAEELDDQTVRLMRDLREGGAESVERLAGKTAPEGAKGGPFTIGALALVAVPAVLPSLVSFLQSWSLRGESRKVRIKTPAGRRQGVQGKRVDRASGTPWPGAGACGAGQTTTPGCALGELI